MRKIVFICCLWFQTAIAQNGNPSDTYYHTSDVQPLMATYDADKGNLSRFYTIIN